MCTGQKPNTEVLTTLDPSLLAPNGRARVTRTLQLGSPDSMKLDASASPAPHVDTPASLASQLDALQLDSQQPASPASPAYPQIFAAGDCADAFNALCAGHNAYYQGQLAARNVLRLARNQEKPDDEKEELEKYEPLPPAIKVSLGLVSVLSALSRFLPVVCSNSYPRTVASCRAGTTRLSSPKRATLTYSARSCGSSTGTRSRATTI